LPRDTPVAAEYLSGATSAEGGAHQFTQAECVAQRTCQNASGGTPTRSESHRRGAKQSSTSPKPPQRLPWTLPHLQASRRTRTLCTPMSPELTKLPIASELFRWLALLSLQSATYSSVVEIAGCYGSSVSLRIWGILYSLACVRRSRVELRLDPYRPCCSRSSRCAPIARSWAAHSRFCHRSCIDVPP